MNWIDVLIVMSGVAVLALVAWSFVRAGKQSEQARQREVLAARLQAIRDTRPEWNRFSRRVR